MLHTKAELVPGFALTMAVSIDCVGIGSGYRVGSQKFFLVPCLAMQQHRGRAAARFALNMAASLRVLLHWLGVRS